MWSIFLVSGTVGLVYLIEISAFIIAWKRLKNTEASPTPSTKISVVIAVRNEAQNIPALFQSLTQLNYPAHLFEMILVDDHSTDSTAKIVENLCANISFNLNYQPLELGKEGKKQALKKGYELAKNSIIATTDGDCTVPKNWLNVFANAFEKQDIMFCSGGVKFPKSESFLSMFQWLELMSLVGSGGAAIALRKPILCNGSNLAFRKSLLNELDTNALHQQYSSGDDIFLLLSTKKKFGPQSIRFLKNADHWVTTNPEKTWKETVNQRLRWVSKSGGYKGFFLLFTSLVVFLMNFCIVIGMPLSLVHENFFWSFIGLFMAKLLVDFIFLSQITSAEKNKKWLWFYPLLGIIYPIFISFTAIWGQFSAFRWKDRIYKK